jgi:serine/threonine-protein kinase HipA
MNGDVDVHLDDEATRVGTLRFAAAGNRESATFEYADDWLKHPEKFEIDPGLPLVRGAQFPTKSPSSVFFGCFADSEPDGWAKTVIRRDRAKRRQDAARSGEPFDDRPLDSFDYLLSVDDVSRIGALRLRSRNGPFVRATAEGERGAPPLIELDDLLRASKAVETHTETAADLKFLLGFGTSVGGMRPKASIIDEAGDLCIGKFPSVSDERSVVKGEVLALRLASMAGIESADARVVTTDGGVAVAVVKRFDRHAGTRRMYASARTLMGVRDADDHTYTEIAETILKKGDRVQLDLRQLWRRIVFGCLISNVDDHLNNHGFIHVANGRWRLSPAFDINPFPEKARVLKTWISEESGPDASIDAAMTAARFFALGPDEAKEVLAEVEQAVSQWRAVARQPEIGMTTNEMEAFEEAFEHSEREVAKRVSAASAPAP